MPGTIKKWTAERTEKTCLQKNRRIGYYSRQAPLVVCQQKGVSQQHKSDLYARQILLHELHRLRPAKVSKPVTVRHCYLRATRHNITENYSGVGRHN
jgi:hypothetical protein